MKCQTFEGIKSFQTETSIDSKNINVSHPNLLTDKSMIKTCMQIVLNKGKKMKSKDFPNMQQTGTSVQAPGSKYSHKISHNL